MKSKYNINNYTGRSINNWTVLSFSHLNDKHDQYWNCKCKCGKVQKVRAPHIINGKSKGCSNCRGQSVSNSKSPYWKGGKFIASTLLTQYHLSAKNRGIVFKLTISDLEEQWLHQNGKCVYTGELLTLPLTSRDKNFTASLDRIDSSKGYIRSNIQWVTKEINFMKINLTSSRFLELCEKVYNISLTK